VQALYHIDVLIHDRVEGTRLVLAVLEVTLLVQGQRLTERLRDGPAQLARCLKRKELQPSAQVGV
jgi:hypothetical protein